VASGEIRGDCIGHSVHTVLIHSFVRARLFCVCGYREFRVSLSLGVSKRLS
jgi:hypothetical protein